MVVVIAIHINQEELRSSSGIAYVIRVGDTVGG
jgi:hypothetical protein